MRDVPGPHTSRLGRPMSAAAAVLILVIGGACSSDEGGSGNPLTGERTEETAAPPETAGEPATTETTTDQAASEDPITGDGLAIVPELVAEVEPSIVAIVVTTARGRGGEGSGVIVRSEGIIVTNAHVVADAADVEVALADGTFLPATVLATDTFTDLAVLEVDRDDLPAVTFADDLPEIGELAVALGNPLGFENTVTAGIISGVQRSIPGASAQGGQALVDLIQTDAAISPGNSGGALIDGEGRLVGINVAFIPPAAGAVSLGFAIPSVTVTDVVEELLEDGRARHAFLGVQATSLTPQIAERFDIGVTRGVVVRASEPGGPASQAGLRPGDVIVAVNDRAVADTGGFLGALRGIDPGDQLVLTVLRDGREQTVEIEAGERPPG